MKFHWNKIDDKIGSSFRFSSIKQLVVIFIIAIVTLLSGDYAAVTQAEQEEKGGYLAFLPTTLRADCFRYIEEDNLLVMEVEHAPPVDQWVPETILIGYTGESYYTWHGPNYFGNPGNAILNYPILINNPGEFNFRLHNRHDYPDPTEENDVWVRVDNGPWIKAFSPIAGQWTWATFFDFGTSQTNASFLLSAGDHTLQISARSRGFSIDRIHLHKNAEDEDTSLPVSDCI